MVKVIVGLMGSSVASGSQALSTPDQLTEFLDVVRAHKVHELDTARVYNDGKSEELLGAVPASKNFAISTKAPAFMPGSLKREKIIDNGHKSFEALGRRKMDIYYLHGPDRTVSLEEQCEAVNQLYREGLFERFGVSNLKDAEVQEIHDICKQKGYVMPSVYQGGFNPLHRRAADTLMPLLRKLNMVFYAYSPLAGGLLVKPVEDILKPMKGSRFDKMPVFGDLFLNETMIGELRKLTGVCKAKDISIMEATLRWFKHHSPLAEDDGVILGASRTQQVEASLSATEKGPLPEDVAKKFEDMWQAVKEKAPAYSF